jgi:hypothetical protein
MVGVILRTNLDFVDFGGLHLVLGPGSFSPIKPIRNRKRRK